MSDSVGRDDGSAAILALDPKRAAENAAADGIVEKKQKLKGDCRGCGKAMEDLTACLCFGSTDGHEGGVILCVQCCAKDVTRCEKCRHLICLADWSTDDHEDCRDMEMCELCGYDPDLPGEQDCGAAICETCYKGSGWNNCFCSKVKFCPSCSLSGNQAFHLCNRCGTLYCSDESGDCGRDCMKCMQMICCKCLGVSDPRSLNYCAGCEPGPKHKKRRFGDDRYSDDDEDSEGCHDY
mmetsp:Transcript_21459/g.46629  ORF Transcript_21459/g.46629 Transcript_21459/m.46629 type:complete len:237 (+) Transcript_21459:111-821(+)|eukprot:CAMPEP_0172317402 /NCGR_PEP_ID=MMETSP1058-20130122/31488_1 /TAXON_ID=83371 /ORGANISM="Detonula confervacea, Strain CCMP 353" /LENGTH=236 /DNA_ID=CAMNT_0013031953 /DNA_START=44 /DNA_END=754 /DNA_ORIENTATION=-